VAVVTPAVADRAWPRARLFHGRAITAGGAFGWLAVGLPVTLNLILLRAVTEPVAYLNDSSMHEQMVRDATAQLHAGHLPLTSWFPFLGLGSPDFLHYQSLPAIITGAAGLVIGPDVAFRWSLYLLLALWPVCVYGGARLFGLGRLPAGCAAMMSPLLASVPGIGYEQNAYLWIGFGVWTQLWASAVLPLAWGLSWRTMRTGSGVTLACAATALTVALHFETGYLALMPLLIWPVLADGPRVRRARRALILLLGSLALASWVVVPVIQQQDWASVNEALQGTPLENGYGAHRILSWLITGNLLDAGRLPVISAFAALGCVWALCGLRTDPTRRALLVLTAACLALSFGRTTFGVAVHVVPGSADLFFRRFMMGAQLGLLLLAGCGAAWTLRGADRVLESFRRRIGQRPASAPGWLVLRTGLAITATSAALVPAWRQMIRFDARNARAVATQRAADAREGPQVTRLLKIVRRQGSGRVYAGQPSTWGNGLRVGSVPVYKYLENEDVDEVGYTLRTASLMTDPEAFFDATNPSDYRLFGIRYLILPVGWRPPVRASRRATAGPYALWTIAAGGYVHVGTIVGRTAASRTDVGRQSLPVLHSDLAARARYLTVAWGGASAAVASTPTGA
jgi:hypothetical protein